MAGWPSCRFITLTLKATSDSLVDRFATMDAAFTLLRSMPVWKDNVTHAISIPEVTVGKVDQWHVHLHILCSGAFIPWAQLKAAWKLATGDSYIVDVQAVNDREDASSYVAGYVAKPADMVKWDEERVREFATATHGRRMIRTYGLAKLPKLDDDVDDDTVGPSSHLCSVNAMLAAETAGLEHVRHAIDLLARMGPTLAQVLDRPMPEPATPQPDIREYRYARDVAAIVESRFPSLPTSDELERCRRQCFGEPEPAPAPRWTQLGIDGLAFLWRK